MSSRRLTRVVAATLIIASVVGAQMPAVGKPAPAFTAKGHDGTDVTFPPAGQWGVLAFYPKAATPG